MQFQAQLNRIRNNPKLWESLDCSGPEETAFENASKFLDAVSSILNEELEIDADPNGGITVNIKGYCFSFLNDGGVIVQNPENKIYFSKNLKNEISALKAA
jgi:hypothetical protein